MSGTTPISCLRFHASLFRRDPATVAANDIVVDGVRLTMLSARGDTLAQRLDVSFDEAVAALLALEGVDVEPDGFFLISGDLEGGRWHVSGQLWEHSERIWRVDLRGECPITQFDRLRRCFGWPEVQLMYELVHEGVLVSESDFERWAARSGRRDEV